MKIRSVSRFPQNRGQTFARILAIIATLALIGVVGIELLPLLLAPGLLFPTTPGSLGSATGAPFVPPILVDFPLPITGWLANMFSAAPWIALVILLISLLIFYRTPRSNHPSYSRWLSIWLYSTLVIALLAGIGVSNMAWAVDQGAYNGTILRHVAMVSATEGWAVGGFDVDSGRRHFGVIWHYSQGKWSRDPATLTREQLFDVTALPNGDAWAVGGSATILHEHKGIWTMIPLLGKGFDDFAYSNPTIYGITMLSPTEGWAVGGPMLQGDSFLMTKSGKLNNGRSLSSGSRSSSTAYLLTGLGYNAPPEKRTFDPDPYDCLILHYTGGQWSRVPCPVRSEYRALTSVSVLPNGDVWTAGVGELILHEHNGVWTSVGKADQYDTSSSIQKIVMTSPTEGWVLEYGSLLHYQDGKLTDALRAVHDNISQPLLLRNFVMASPTEGWAVGEGGFLHYTNGTWQLVKRFQNQSDETAMGIALVPGHPNENWVVGSNGLQPLILHGHDGVWSPYNN